MLSANKKSPSQWADGEEAGLTEEGHTCLYGTSGAFVSPSAKASFMFVRLLFLKAHLFLSRSGNGNICLARFPGPFSQRTMSWVHFRVLWCLKQNCCVPKGLGPLEGPWWLSCLPSVHMAVAETRPRPFTLKLKPFSSSINLVSFCHYLSQEHWPACWPPTFSAFASLSIELQ